MVLLAKEPCEPVGSPAVRVLLVEDDPMIGASLVRGLTDHGYAVDWIRDGAEAQSRLLAEHQQFQMVLLDLGLPSTDGLDLLTAVRRSGSEVPILVITARGGLDHLVTGLDRGADDYMVKPFELAELEARLRALSRRRGGRAAPQLKSARLVLDPALRAVLKEDAVIDLSAKEYAILHALMERPGAVLSRAQLESRIYSWSDTIESNAVDFLLHRLRQKIGAEQIENVRGMGWRVQK
jgi:two-component system OmpR family response regulator